MSTRNLTIMFTDIKGFTERTAAHSRDYVVKMLEKQDKICKPIFARYHGTIIKTIGDAYLVTFESPTNAVICGLMLQHGLRNYNRAASADEKIDIRVAINTGEVSLVGSDVFGDPVNVASRVEGITEAGEVWFTEATYLAMNKQEVPTSIVGEFKLKGVPEAIRVYRGLVDETQILYKRDFPATGSAAGSALGPAAPPFERREAGAPKSIKIGVAVGGLVIALAGTVTFALLSKPAPEKQIAALIAAKKFPQAMQALEPLLTLDPTRESFQELARVASENELREMLGGGQVADAQARFDRYTAKYTFLGAQAKLRRDIRMAEVAQHEKGGKDTLKQQADLQADYPDDPEVMVFIGALRMRYGPAGLRAAMPYFRKALEKQPALAQRPEVQKAFAWALDELSPYELLQRNDHTALYLEHFYTPNRAKLLENVYDAKSDSKRWIAYELLTKKGDAKDIDLLRFQTLNLLDDSIPSELQKKTLAYFEAEYQPGKLADALPMYPALFSSDEEIAKRALALAKGKLRQNLTAALEKAKGSDDDRLKAMAATVLAQ